MAAEHQSSPLNSNHNDSSSTQPLPNQPVFGLMNAPLQLQSVVPPFQHNGDNGSQLGKRQYEGGDSSQPQTQTLWSLPPGGQYTQQPPLPSLNTQQQGNDNGEQQERVVSPLLSPSRAATPPPPANEQGSEHEQPLQSMIPQQQPPQPAEEPPRRLYSQLPLQPSSPERRGKRSKFNFNPERDSLLVQVIWQNQPWNSTQTLETTWQNVTNDFNDAANLQGVDGFKWKSCRDRFQTLAKQAEWTLNNIGPPTENSTEMQKLLYQCNEEMRKAAEATSHVTKRRRSTKKQKAEAEAAAAAAAAAAPAIPDTPPQVQEPEQEELADLAA